MSGEFRQIILDRMRELQYSPYRLAKESGVEPSGLSRYFSGETGLSEGSIHRIFIVLGIKEE